MARASSCPGSQSIRKRFPQPRNGIATPEFQRWSTPWQRTPSSAASYTWDLVKSSETHDSPALRKARRSAACLPAGRARGHRCRQESPCQGAPPGRCLRSDPPDPRPRSAGAPDPEDERRRPPRARRRVPNARPIAATATGNPRLHRREPRCGLHPSPGLPTPMFIGGAPMNEATKTLGRTVKDFQRWSVLLDLPVTHDDDHVAHRHRFHLVMGHVHHRGLEPPVELDELLAHGDAQVRASRLLSGSSNRNTLGIAHDDPPHRDPLALSAGELRPAFALRSDSMRRMSAARRTRPSISDRATLRIFRPKSHVLEQRSCPGRARSSGTPWQCPGPWARRR